MRFDLAEGIVQHQLFIGGRNAVALVEEVQDGQPVGFHFPFDLGQRGDDQGKAERSEGKCKTRAASDLSQPTN